jgi:hypothetical protein
MAVRYLSRRIGRSQNGMARGSPWPWPLAEPPPSGGGAGALDPAADRCRVAGCRVVAPDHPFDGQAGPPADRAGPRSDPETAEPAEVARTRAPDAPAGPADVERPAPRDQPETALADPFGDAAGPGLDDPFGDAAGLGDPFGDAEGLGGRSSGGAVRPPPSASPVALLRAWPVGLAIPRDPELTSSPPSTAGGASGRNRDAYVSPAVACPVPLLAAASADAAATVAAPTPTVTPVASAAA